MHPHIDTVRNNVWPGAPRCQAWPKQPDGKQARCPRPGAVWLVAPDDQAVTIECAECAEAVLAEYAAHPDLAGWYSVPLVIVGGYVDRADALDLVLRIMEPDQ